jgi:hypothetical protein
MPSNYAISNASAKSMMMKQKVMKDVTVTLAVLPDDSKLPPSHDSKSQNSA